MAGRYWKPTLVLLAAGLVCIFCLPSYGFLGFVLCAVAALFAAFGLIDRLKLVFPISMRIVRHVLRTLVMLILVLATATGIWILSTASGAEEAQADYVIVLGAGVNGDTPSRSLRERLDAALDYLNAYPDAIAILSGGQGNGENLSEAQCMHRWLTGHGISPSRLRMEEQATSTRENIRFSLDRIEAETGVRPTRVAVVSNEYHLLRASLLARREQVELLGYPAASTSPAYFCNMLLREICGVWAAILIG